MQNIRFDLPMIHLQLQGRCYFYFFWNELAAGRGQITVHVSQAKCSGFAQCAARHRTKAAQALEGPGPE
jgi:hypothetical protein